jgi:hypothetical protein
MSARKLRIAVAAEPDGADFRVVSIRVSGDGTVPSGEPTGNGRPTTG